MVEGGALKLILKMLKSKKNDLRETAAGTLGKMVEHGVINHLRVIVELTNLTQRTSVAPWLKGVL